MKKYRHYVLLTLVLAVLPSLLRLPLWVAAIAIVGGAIHYSGEWRKKLYGKLVAASLLCFTAAGIWFSFDSWFSGDSVLSFFIVVVFLKWGESESRRDFLLLIFAAVILATVGALAFDNLLNLMHMVLVIFSLTISLTAIHLDDTLSSSSFLLKKCSVIFVLALPLMLLLFLTFPRIPGPLWDLGVAFGLPIKAMMDKGNGEFGKVKTLQPGGIQLAKESNGNVLVAEFEGPPPFKSRLYWRGPVFYEFDGQQWSLPEDWNNRNSLLGKSFRGKMQYEKELHHRKEQIRYTLRVMPNGGRWLYGLDVPAAPAPEAFISDDYQLLSIRTLNDHEPKLQLRSYLEYQAGTRLTPEKRVRALSWPEGQNPRILELGKKLQETHTDPDEILLEGYKLLATGDYTFDTAHIISPGDHTLDRYLFDEKRGGAEYLAGSIVMLMRAAGIPARLVSGFRGGTIIALTNFVIVKQGDSHAWVEVWFEGRGWSRVEPKDIVLPPDKKAVPAPQPKKEKRPQVEVKREQVQVEKQEKTPPGTTPPQKAPRHEKKVEFWQLPSISDLFGNLQNWVINYDPDKQMEILKGVGLEGSNWLDLMIGSILGVAALLGIYLGGVWIQTRKKVGRVTASWRKFCGRLTTFDLVKMDHECPRNYLARISADRPELETAAGDIINRYIEIRYGSDESKQSQELFTRQVKRFISMT